jgi:lipopolysaccharide export LptBFGC system permease protein LptF
MVHHAEKTSDDISKDLFVVSSAKQLGYKMLTESGVIEGNWGTRCQPRPYKKNETYLPGGQRRFINATKRQEVDEEMKKNKVSALWKRFWVSFFGGLALIAPMLLMVLHRDQTTALATTSGSVLLFACIVSLFTSATPEVAIGAVAAYAAVLVVFVGSVLPPAA